MIQEKYCSKLRKSPKFPAMWWVGGTDPAKIAESERTGVPVPSNHSATFAPVPEPTLKACVTSMTAAILELMRKPKAQ